MVRGEPGGNGMASVSGGGVAEVPISELVFDRSGIAENLGNTMSVESVGMLMM